MRRGRERLLRPLHLVILAVVLGAALWRLFTPRERFRSQRLDELSVAYLRAQASLQPGDHPLRLQLVRQLLGIGRLREARRALQPLLQGVDTRVLAQARLLRLLLEQAEGADLAELQADVAALAARDAALLGPGDVERLAQVALQLQRPDVAANLYEDLARAGAEEERLRASERAAEAALAAGQPRRAGELYRRAAERAGDAARARRLALLAVRALRAADQGDEALQVARRQLLRAHDDPELLELAIGLAQSQGLVREARRLGRVLLQQRPADRPALQRQLVLELAARDLHAALSVAERLFTLRPGSRAEEQVARIALWAGEPGRALQHLVRLAHRGAPGVLERSLELARGLHHDRALSDLQAERLRRGDLPAEALEELVAAYERLGEPERAAAELGAHLRRHPEDARARRLRGELLERMGELREAAAELERAGGRDQAAALRAAELRWRLGDPDAALRALGDPRGGVLDVEVEALRGELAFRTERFAVARDAYLRLWRAGRGGPVDPGERLALLQIRLRDDRGLQRLMEEALQRLAPRVLLRCLEGALARGTPALLVAALRQAERAEPLLRAHAQYWLWRGQLAQRLGHAERAQGAYEELLRRESPPPEAEAALGDLLWLLMDQLQRGGRPRERAREGLTRWLGRWQERALARASLWRVYAAAYTAIGQPREALPWYELEWLAHPQDALLLMRYADALEQAGRAADARRLRRQALQALLPDARAALAQRGERDEGRLAAYAALQGTLRGAERGARWRRRLHLRRELLDALRPAGAAGPRAEVAVRVGMSGIGALLATRGEVRALAARGRLSAQLRAGGGALRYGGAAVAEGTLGLRGRLRYGLGATELGVGGELRAQGSLLTAHAAQELALGPVELRAALAYNELGEDTAALRALGARHRAALGARVDLPQLWAAAEAALRGYQDRSGAALGRGYAVEVEAGVRLLGGPQQLLLRGTGAWMQNSLVAQLPAGLAAALPAGTRVTDVVPAWFAQVGGGITWLSQGPLPVGYAAELWMGWLWPGGLGYRARGALTLALPPPFSDGELALQGHVGNDLAGAPGGAPATYSLGVEYLHRFGGAAGERKR